MKIEVTSTHRSGETIVHPGVYRVPQDISKADAEAAIEAGNATRLGQPETVKKEAPQNKSFRAAPENKAETGDHSGNGPVADKRGRKPARKSGKK